MQDRTIVLYNEDGSEIVCEIIFTYFSEEFNKNYVVFQVKETGEVSAATYDEKDENNGVLGRVETDEEWEMLEELLADYCEQLENNNCGGNCGGCPGCGSDDCDCECDCDCE